MGFSTRTLNSLHSGAVKILIAAGLVGFGLTVQTIRTMQEIPQPNEGTQIENKKISEDS